MYGIIAAVFNNDVQDVSKGFRAVPRIFGNSLLVNRCNTSNIQDKLLTYGGDLVILLKTLLDM